jgi:hypothetical protein
MAWYVNANGETWGPVDDAQVIAWIQAGRLLAGNICLVGSQQWVDLATHPAFAAALRQAAPPPPPTSGTAAAWGANMQARPQVNVPPIAKPGPMDPRLKLWFWITGFGLFALISWGGVLIGLPMIGWAEFARRKKRASFTSWVLGRPPSRGQSLASLAIGVVFLTIGCSRLVAGWVQDLSAAREARALEQAKQLHQADLRSQIPTKVAEWQSKLSQAKTAAEAPTFDDGRIATVDRVTADITAFTSDLAPPWPPDLSQLKSQAAAVREECVARLEFEHALVDVRQQIQEAKQQATARQWVAADQAYGAALQDLDSLAKAAPWLTKFLPTGFEIASKQKEVAALRSQIAGPVAAEKQRAEKAEAARQAKEAKEAAYAELCGERPVLSAWDGELIGVAYVLKESANDPDSIDVKNCTSPMLSSDNCWISTCDVRGKNGFGAKILKRMTFSKSKLGFSQISE